MSKDKDSLLSQIKVTPSDVVALKPNATVDISIENTGKKQVAYKLKTTRPATVKPAKTFGMLKKGAKEKVKFHFKPTAKEKPFLKADRITIVVSVMPEKFTSAEKFWKSANAMANAKKITLKLQKVGDKPAAKKSKQQEEQPEEEEETTSEESQAEDEDNTAEEA